MSDSEDDFPDWSGVIKQNDAASATRPPRRRGAVLSTTDRSENLPR